MKQDTALYAQAAVSIVAIIAFTVLVIYSVIYHNITLTVGTLGALAAIYAHWIPSPLQQNVNASLLSTLQQLEPILLSIVKSAETQQQQKETIEPHQISYPATIQKN